jgi:hypothetical protein
MKDAPGYMPFQRISEEQKNNGAYPGEIQKLLNLNEPEKQNLKAPILDEDSALAANDYELLDYYVKAKYDHLVDHTLKQAKVCFRDLEERDVLAKQWDDHVIPRVEFMYNYLDFYNDRHTVRERFVNEINKKTTLEDVGKQLDKFVLDSKASLDDLFVPEKHITEQPYAASQDYSSDSLTWEGTFLSDFDPKRPQWMEDQTLDTTLDTLNWENRREV